MGIEYSVELNVVTGCVLDLPRSARNSEPVLRGKLPLVTEHCTAVFNSANNTREVS